MLGKIKYPIYVISKGRFDKCLTANFLIKDDIDFTLVVEPQEFDKYFKKYGDRVIKLPFSNLGLGSYPARNWCWEDSIVKGFTKHWILDDNINGVKRLYKGVRIPSNSQHAFKLVENITANYINVGVSGMNYTMFAGAWTKSPVIINHHIYSNLLIQNDLPLRWRLRYNEDTDLNLQVLEKGLCTLYINIFLIEKMGTMTMKGGNSDELYKGNGRLKMARMLEMVWPKYVQTKWRYGRPQHVVSWNKFKQPLIKIENPKVINLDDYGKLKVKSEIKSERLKKILGIYK